MIAIAGMIVKYFMCVSPVLEGGEGKRYKKKNRTYTRLKHLTPMIMKLFSFRNPMSCMSLVGDFIGIVYQMTVFDETLDAFIHHGA